MNEEGCKKKKNVSTARGCRSAAGSQGGDRSGIGAGDTQRNEQHPGAELYLPVSGSPTAALLAVPCTPQC